MPLKAVKRIVETEGLPLNLEVSVTTSVSKVKYGETANSGRTVDKINRYRDNQTGRNSWNQSSRNRNSKAVVIGPGEGPQEPHVVGKVWGSRESKTNDGQHYAKLEG